MHQSRVLAAIILVLLSPQLLFGWSEGGHHLIGYMAFKLMKPERPEKLLELIKQNPLYEKDFKPPKNVVEASDVPIWLAGRACYWPDVAQLVFKRLNGTVGLVETSRWPFDRASWYHANYTALAINALIMAIVTIDASYPPEDFWRTGSGSLFRCYWLFCLSLR